ncbi:opioid growth factor receptor-like protein 1 isoform X3 [Pipistrellus kuhlii]|uniref:opioid growth factor receptor-like protein 1 isoform X3 n=1 Tax=Pipistrellus kuhlii TaxID=59472 RepID=UPI00174F523E|nr:opioid growth factor receptor-like protein 1 isoform X3 [Pipistrellus kuhlii]
MGNLLGGVSFREPTTVEDCDSTWQTESEPEPEESEPEEPGPGSGEGPGQEPEQPAQPPEPAGGRPRASPAPDQDAEAAGAEQGADSTEATAKPKRSFYAARDLYKYRHQYPQNCKDIRYQNDLSNLRFYKNKIPFKPDGVYIEEVLSKWKGDYEKLEHNHTYIQWSQHNYLRITRILKSLGELGYESFKPPLVKFILHEALVENTIPNIKQSALEYFVYTIKDRRERRKLLRFAQKHYTPSENFIWGPPRKEDAEGGKAQKMPAPPASSPNSQTSMHKKSKDSKTSSSAAPVNSKAAEEKIAAPKEPEEVTDRPCTEPSSGAARPGDTEDGNAESSNSQPEEATSNPTEKTESASPPEKDEEGASHSKDCGSPGNQASQDEELIP